VKGDRDWKGRGEKGINKEKEARVFYFDQLVRAFKLTWHDSASL
jgi:hypothetical protein